MERTLCGGVSGPGQTGSDSELIRQRCALRRDAACGLETWVSIDVALQARRTSMKLMKLKIFNEEKKQTTKLQESAESEGADFCCFACLLLRDQSGTIRVYEKNECHRCHPARGVWRFYASQLLRTASDFGLRTGSWQREAIRQSEKSSMGFPTYVSMSIRNPALSSAFSSASRTKVSGSPSPVARTN